MPTFATDTHIAHRCRMCGAERTYPRQNVDLFVKGGIGFGCDKCRLAYDDFGYDDQDHLVLTREECRKIEDAGWWGHRQPIRYKSVQDSGADEADEDTDRYP